MDITPSKFQKTIAGTYRFLQAQNGEMYIGSTGSFYDRIASHRKKFNSKSKQNIGPLHRSQLTQPETLLFSIIHKLPNLIELWKLENPRYPLLQGEGDLLNLLTYYPLRVLDQNLIDNFKPSINGGNADNVIVTHSLTKSSPNAFNQIFKVAGKSINIFDRHFKLLFKAPSLRSAVRYMGLPANFRLDVYIGNLRGILVNRLGNKIKYLINYDSANWTNRSFVKPKISYKFDLPNLELTSLNKAYIYLFSYPDLQKFLVFRTLASAYEFLYPGRMKTSFSCNRKKANAAFKFAISDKANTGFVVKDVSGNSYIIAKHPEWKGGNSILVWAVNLETRDSKLYTSIQSALSELNINLGAIKTDPGTYCIDTGVRFYSELPNLDAKGGFKQSTKQNLTNDIPKSTSKNILLNTKLQNSLVRTRKVMVILFLFLISHFLQ